MHKPQILIVEDTPTDVQVLSENLKQDYRIRVADSGKAALDELARGELPDLILLDVVMPDMDGYELCARIKQNPETRRVPVIFVTAMKEAADEERGLMLGAMDYITKPFHIAIVKARIQNHVSLKLTTDLLESMAWLDGLTGIPNRRRFDEALDSEWKRAQRSGTPLSVILIDIDHFKEFNDHYGHGAGDNCLRNVAKILAASVVRAGDMLARYGGEEFVLLMPATDGKGAKLLAEQLRSNVEKLCISHEYTTVSGCVTISAGYASVIPGQNDQARSLLEKADQMLYLAKGAGRNRVHGVIEGQ